MTDRFRQCIGCKVYLPIEKFRMKAGSILSDGKRGKSHPESRCLPCESAHKYKAAKIRRANRKKQAGISPEMAAFLYPR